MRNFKSDRSYEYTEFKELAEEAAQNFLEKQKKEENVGQAPTPAQIEDEFKKFLFSHIAANKRGFRLTHAALFKDDTAASAASASTEEDPKSALEKNTLKTLGNIVPPAFTMEASDSRAIQKVIKKHRKTIDAYIHNKVLSNGCEAPRSTWAVLHSGDAEQRRIMNKRVVLNE